MKVDTVTLSAKYQVVIPKSARRKLGLVQASTKKQLFRVTKVTADEIVFKKDKSLEDFLGAYSDSFPKNAQAQLRKLRDSEWD